MKKIAICGALSTCFLATVSAQTTIFSEDFQQGIPGSWTIIVNDTNTVDSTVAEFAPGWIALPDPGNAADTVAGATSFFTEPAQADRWLITPAFTVGAYGNFIGWQARVHDPSYQDGYYVLVSTTDTQIASFTDTIAIVPFEEPEWTDHEADLSAEGYNNQTIHVAFVLRSYDMFKLYLDDVSVRIEDPLAIHEPDAQPKIQLYPNPATDRIVVKGEQIEAVRMIGMNGQTVLTQTCVSGQAIDISSFEAGTYLIEVLTQNGIAHSRFVKQ